MAFYLSKRNRDVLNLVSGLLKDSKEDVKIETPYPDRLANVIRNASADPEFKWIKEKFIIKTIPNHVLCQIKDIPIVINEEYEVHPEPVGLLDIANIIMAYNPIRIKFTDFSLSEDEMDRLGSILELKNYSSSISDGTLTIKKK